MVSYTLIPTISDCFDTKPFFRKYDCFGLTFVDQVAYDMNLIDLSYLYNLEGGLRCKGGLVLTHIYLKVEMALTQPEHTFDQQ